MSKKRYIVMGGFCEYMAHIQCIAHSEFEALEKWNDAFPDCSREVFSPEVCCVDDLPGMEKHWKGNGDRFYSGGYRYVG